CTLSAPVQITLPESFAQERTDDDEDHGHDLHAEASDHGHGAHEDTKHQDDHDVHANDVELTYVFDCPSPSRLRAITMKGFDAFPAIENVDAVFLGEARQAARRLGRGTQTLMVD
ncbi:MAG: ZrgA family zinc uptake protein, partial [Hyphococcus sp.]